MTYSSILYFAVVIELAVLDFNTYKMWCCHLTLFVLNNFGKLLQMFVICMVEKTVFAVQNFSTI